MIDLIDVVAAVIIVLGVFLLVVSTIGLLRLPDFFTRSHAVAKAETLGLLLIVVGLIVHNRFGAGTVQLVLIALFSFLANPTAMHALARLARRSGIEPWTRRPR